MKAGMNLVNILVGALIGWLIGSFSSTEFSTKNMINTTEFNGFSGHATGPSLVLLPSHKALGNYLIIASKTLFEEDRSGDEIFEKIESRAAELESLPQMQTELLLKGIIELNGQKRAIISIPEKSVVRTLGIGETIMDWKITAITDSTVQLTHLEGWVRTIEMSRQDSDVSIDV